MKHSTQPFWQSCWRLCSRLFFFFTLLAGGQAGAQQTCGLSPEAIARQATLLQASLRGKPEAQTQYQALVAEQAQSLRQCRSQTWPQVKGIWLQLFACDLQPGVLESVLDRIVSQGYNRIYVQTFYDGQVLLPANRNPTPWLAVAQGSAFADKDLLAEVIQKGRERGLRVYAWVSGLNYGSSYAQRGDRQQTLVQNGRQPATTPVGHTGPGFEQTAIFIDPYHPDARADFQLMLQAVLQRQPDGVLIDHLRYPRQSNPVLTEVKDLWIYGPASRLTLRDRALNDKGRATIDLYLKQGKITETDLKALEQKYPQEREPLWQGRLLPTLAANQSLPTVTQRLTLLQQDLWLLSVAHAYQGVVDFLNAAILPIRQRGLGAGAAFFPEGNQRSGRGFDPRLQPWDQFPGGIEWHPLTYAACGESTCLVEQLKPVIQRAPADVQISPVLAGRWGQSSENRPALEVQMAAIHQTFPQINAINHFDFSRQNPELTQSRRTCSVKL